jgi:hypothetical protein
MIGRVTRSSGFSINLVFECFIRVRLCAAEPVYDL